MFFVLLWCVCDFIWCVTCSLHVGELITYLSIDFGFFNNLFFTFGIDLYSIL